MYPYFQFNLSFSENIYCSVASSESEETPPPDHWLIATAQKIAVYALIPFAMIMAFEGVVKNGAILLANGSIFLINTATTLYQALEKSFQGPNDRPGN